MRRRTLLGSGLAMAAVAAASPGLAQARTRRLSWNRFRQTPGYRALGDAIDRMRRNRDPADPDSWEYWARIHQTDCPHGQGYFLAWHRGYLARFEARLRAISGVATLTVPYWDYFTDPQMPIEFRQQETPFFYWSRTNTDVSAALGYGFTDPSVTDFERGRPNAMEPSIEQWPHNRVHSVIGGEMGGMLSPRDPIFWLHHANVDRLWSAWVRAGGGRAMPSRDAPYWRGSFSYGREAPMARIDTYDTAGLGYDYDVETLPAPTFRLAPPAPAARALRMAPGGTDGRTLSLSETDQPLVLGERSFSVRVPLDAAGRSTVEAVLAPPPPPPPPAPVVGAPPGAAPAPRPVMAAPPPPQVNIVLDDVRLTEVGREGGFFYDVYVNLPRRGSAPEMTRLVGSFGPFDIATAAAHAGDEGHAAHDEGRGARIVLPATEILRDLPPDALRRLTVSFVRVDGPISPRGPAITVGALRVEVAGG